MLALVGGILAGWLGIGGGVIYNPILLKFGIHPQVVSATSLFIVMFVTLSSVILFFIAGMVQLDYAALLAIVAIAITYFSIVQVNKAVQRSGRASIVVFFLTAVIAISALVIPVYGVFQEKGKEENGVDIWDFNSTC